MSLSPGVGAVRRAFVEHPPTAAQWARSTLTLGTALQRQGIEDPQLTTASIIASTLAAPGAASTTEQAMVAAVSTPLATPDILHLRTTLAIAAQRATAATPQQGRALAVAAQALVVPPLDHTPAAASLAAALDRCTAVALTEPTALRDPRVARAVALSQFELAADVADALPRVQTTGDQQLVDTDRAAELARRAQDGWLTAARSWAQRSTQTVGAPAQDRRIAIAMRELAQARRSTTLDPVELVRTVARSDAAPALADALTTHHRAVDLTPAKHLARGLTVLAHNHDLATLPPAPLSIPVRSSVAPHAPARAQTATPARQRRHDPGIGAGVVPQLTPEQEANAARSRDLGILAEAALSGNPVARQITGDLPSADLRDLRDDGHRAVATMVTSVVPLTYVVARGRGQDVQQAAHEAVIRAAYRWDPNSVGAAPWPNYAARAARGNAGHAGEKQGKITAHELSVPTAGVDRADEAETRGRDWFVTPDHSDQVIDDVDTPAAIARLTATLTEKERTVLLAASGALTGDTATRAEMAERLGLPPSTVHANLQRAREKIAGEVEAHRGGKVDEDNPFSRVAGMLDRLERLQESIDARAERQQGRNADHRSVDYSQPEQQHRGLEEGPGLSR